MEFLSYGTSQQTTVTPDHLASKPRHPHSCATLTLPFLCSLLHVHVWMDDCILAEKLLHQTNTNFNSTQTVSSPVQVTQPSSTQDSFAKSNGPALFFSPCFLSFCLSLLPFLAGLDPHCPHCLHEERMEDGGQAVRGLADGWGIHTG